MPTLICDGSGHILEVNAAFTQLLGYGTEELAGKRVSEITHPADLEGHHGRLTMLISGQEDQVKAEKRYVRRDGSTVWGSISVAVAKDESGRPMLMISQIRDITSERKTREKLLESEGRLQAIMDNTNALVYAKDLTGHYILVNRQFERIFQLKREEVTGRTDFEIFPEDLAKCFAENDRKVAEAQEGMQFEEEAQQMDGRHTYVSVKFPLRNVRGQIVAVCGISTDITDRKASERRLQELNERLVRANEELKKAQLHLIQAEKLESVGRLAAGVAHEVKNPLATLQLSVDYLEGNVATEDPNVAVILADMREAIDRAERIIRGLVDFSADRQLKLQALEVNDVIRRAELLVRHELTKHSVSVTHEFAENLPPVLLDQMKMEQVMVNLLMNAIHAMQAHNGGVLTLRTRLAKMESRDRDAGARTADHLRGGDDVVVIEIQDSGPGIPAELLPKLFDPFFTTKATGEGTGLGLSVVKKIVELHKGLIKIENAAGGGAKVTLTLRPHTAPTTKTSTAPPS